MEAMRSNYPRMLDLAVQLMQKSERLNPDDTVDVPADMTRLSWIRSPVSTAGSTPSIATRPSFRGRHAGRARSAQAKARELPIQGNLYTRRARRFQADQQLMVETGSSEKGDEPAAPELARHHYLATRIDGVNLKDPSWPDRARPA